MSHSETPDSIFAAGMLGGILHKFETRPVKNGDSYTNAFYITIDGKKFLVTVEEVITAQQL